MYLMNNETQWVIIINTEIFLHVILWHVETMKWGGLMSMAKREIVGIVCYLNPWKVPGPLITVTEILACGTRKRLVLSCQYSQSSAIVTPYGNLILI